MLSADTIRKGVLSVPAFVDEFGLSGGLRRWFGIAYHTAAGDPSGRSIFSAEWDVCVILDACRADELERFTSSFGWLDEVGRFPSLASCTWNWVPQTVDETDPSVLAETIYVSANPFPEELTDPGTFAAVDEVYRYAWDDDRGTVYPGSVTDAAVRQWRGNEPERMVVHYVQPHVPFLSEDAASLSQSNFTHAEESVADAWDRVTKGELDRSVAINRYRESLALALQSVDVLLSSIDAERVVVTADHGEAFGEWGLYGHPQGVDIPALTSVPWAVTDATDDGSYEPPPEPSAVNLTDGERSTADRLRALGYTE